MLNNQIHSVLANKVPTINSKINKINWGGCGHSALALHNELLKLNIFTSIVLTNTIYSRKSVDKMIERMQAKGINGAYRAMFDGVCPDYGYPSDNTYNGHIAIEFDGRLYDSDGEFDGHAISQHITPQVMAQFVEIDSVWNDTFKWANREYTDDVVSDMKRFYNRLFHRHLVGV